MNKLVAFASLALACIFVACSQPSSSSPKPDSGPQPYAIDASAIVGVTAPVPRHRSPGHYVPPPPDPRTPSEIAQAACASPNGAWRCPKMTRKMILAASGISPIIPSSWTVGAWYIDPANSSGCASDSNSGTSATCSTGGLGPLATWGELNVHRWGCAGNPKACPRLRQNTTIEWLSSSSGDSDPVYFFPAVENQSNVILQGALGTAQQIASGLLSNVTAKNRSTPQLLQAQSGATAAGQLVVNATHASRAWTYKLVSGSVYSMSQPAVPLTVPLTSFGCGAEVDTWANGDSVTVYQPVSVNIVAVEPTIDLLDSAFMNYVGIYNLTIADPNSPQLDSVYLSAATLLESRSIRELAIDGRTPFNFGLCNDYTDNAVSAGFVEKGLSWVSAGVLSQSQQNIQVINFDFENDVIIGGSIDIAATMTNGSGFTVAGHANALYVSTGREFRPSTGSFNAVGNNDGVIWGPGWIETTGATRLVYRGGAGGAAATFLLTGGIQPNGGTTACLGIPTATTTTFTCNIAATAANLDSNLGATIGCLFVPGGSSACNGDL